MTKSEIWNQIQIKSSFLCIGLDTDWQKIPPHLKKSSDPIFDFNRQIIDETIDLAVAYKPNTAFYETEGSRGWESLQKTFEYLPESVFRIADAKRGDIGNTASLYARAFFEQMTGVDAVTLAPYMGEDSIRPFLSYPNKWSVILALTSNASSCDFEEESMSNGEQLYEMVLRKGKKWGNTENTMFVVGATKASAFQQIRSIVPDHFLLVPGLGTQGGSLEAVAETGMNEECGLLVNASRSIIYASDNLDFAKMARKKASEIRENMKISLEEKLG
jgi:orotidine-5'-phosphate decarboxylase